MLSNVNENVWTLIRLWFYSNKYQSTVNVCVIIHMSGLTFYSPGAQNPPILEFLSHRQDPIRVSITCVSQVRF